MTLTLEIYSSIIFPKPTSSFAEAVTIDITPPSPSSGAPPRAHPSAPALLTGIDNPIYRLPQSLSSGGLKIHLNAFVKPRDADTPEGQAQAEITRDSRTSIVDKDHILYEISKAPVGADYTLVCFRHGKSSGGYGYGKMEFKSGWFSGGVWTLEYVCKAPGTLVEHRVRVTVDEGGKEDGVWKLVEPVQRTVGKEVRGEGSGENGRGIEVYEDEVQGLAGMTEVEWRDFLAACWITKVWSQETRVPSMGLGGGVRDQSAEARGLGRW